MGSKISLLALTFLAALNVSSQADIYRWDTGEVIPGTAGIEPRPYIQLNDWNTDPHNLRYADFSAGLNLSGVNFSGSWLDYAHFQGANLSNADLRWSTLTQANLSGANLSNAYLASSTLTDANLSGAVVAGAIFIDTSSRGFTKEQLYSTASYKSRNLQGIVFGCIKLCSPNDLTDWDLSGQDLTYAYLKGSPLTNANLAGAVVAGTSFESTTSRGFTQEQLASTASYQSKNLQGIRLGFNDLTGWDLSEQDLTYASFLSSNMTDANLSGATVTGANFPLTTSQGFTQAQLASTASYQAKNLQGIVLRDNDLSGWDFGGQNLSSAWLASTTLTDANLSGANLSNARLNDSTLTGLNLSGANLSNAYLANSTFTEANLTGANLKNANLNGAAAVQSAVFASSTIYNQWTVFPVGFDPVTFGLTLRPSPLGDFDANDVLDIADIDLLQFRIRNGYVNPHWLPPTMFDLNSDDVIDLEDVGVWVKDLKHTYFGDANLDLEFNSTDLVRVFQSGQYENTIAGNSTWSTGDWDTDGDFTSSDLVVAFQDGGYEAGPRAMVAAVPEPGSLILLAIGLCGCLRSRRVP